MIFVTLGTHPRPMNRLLLKLDELVRSGAITDEVLVQGTVFGVRPTTVEVRTVLPHDEYVALIRSAEVVISHAGAGSLAEARLQGKVPIVVPRMHDEGEHVDDHQLRYARRLKGQPSYIVVEDVADLLGAIDAARVASVDISPPDVGRAVAVLSELASER